MQQTMEQSFREMMDDSMGEGWESITPDDVVTLMKLAYMLGAKDAVKRIINEGRSHNSFECVIEELLHFFQGDPRRN